MNVASAPGGEHSSKKKKVSQVAALMVGVLLCTIIVVAVVRGGGSLQLAVPPPPQETTNEDQPDLDAIAREAEQFARLGPETIDARTPQDGAARLTPRAGGQGANDPAYLPALLENLTRRSQPQIAPQPMGPSAGVDEKRDAFHKLLASPMGGVVAVADVNAGGNGGAAPNTAAGVGTRTLTPGTVIEGRSKMEVSSDYPGSPFAAITTRPSYFANGDMAIPAGSTIIATVEQDSGPNQILQGRVGLRLSQIVLPDGVVVAVKDTARVLDSRGVAAIPGETNRHILAQTAGVLAGAVLGTARIGSSSSEPYSQRDAVEGEAIAGASEQATPLVQRYLSVQPTVVPAAGTAVRIFLVEPLEIPAA